MNKKLAYVFISIIFVCILSTSIVCAADNTTSNGNDKAVTSTSSTPQTLTSSGDTGSIADFRNELHNSNGTVNIMRNYAYNNATDSIYKDVGIFVNSSNLVLNGNNHSINMMGIGKLFTAYNSDIKINNLNILNTLDSAIILQSSNLSTSHVSFVSDGTVNTSAVKSAGSSVESSHDQFINLKNEFGSAIATENSELIINNATFSIDHKQKWGAVYISSSSAIIANTTFANMTSKYSTAIHDYNSTMLINNCSFINLEAEQTAGAISVKDLNDSIVITNSRFYNVTSVKNAGAIFADINGMHDIKKGRVIVNNTEFDSAQSRFGGAILQLGGSMVIQNTNFTNNFAFIKGGALYTSYADLIMENITFDNNIVPTVYEDYNQGGAIYFDMGTLNIDKSRFTGNKALEGTDIYMYDADYEISNSYFTGNIESMFDGDKAELRNNTFLGKNIINNNTYYYVYESNGSNIDYNPITLDESLVNESYFNLVDYGLVSPVKDQGDMGACWAFGVTGALESAYLKATNRTVLLDISESNIQSSGLMYYMFGIKDTTEGSKRTVGTSYMLSWLGVTTSEDNSYDELGKINVILDNGTKYHVHKVVLMEPRQNINDNLKFKEALIKYGAIGVSVHGANPSDSSFNTETKAAYFNSTFGDGTDHSVTLVGWNDSFSKYNFKVTPPGDGAWIIKNSWGTDWADKGYYYVSYYDAAFGTVKLPVAFIVDANNSYEKNYQYDIISDLDYIEFEEQVSYANKFNSTGKDLISAVGTYFNNSGTEYIINVYVNDEKVHTQTGISQYPGYETIKLSKLVAVGEGDEFIVEMSTGTSVPVSKNSRQHYKENTSFILSELETIDCSKDGNVVCLKAYTIPDNSYMITTVSGQNVIVQYFDENGEKLDNTLVSFKVKGRTYFRTTNDEGVAVFHVPLSGGKYTVNVINPVNGDEENVTVVTPSSNKKAVKPYKTVKKSKSVENTVKTYKVVFKDKIVFEGRYFTIESLKMIFGKEFINGHLVVYIDGKVVFNDTVNGDFSKILFEIVDSLLGRHELKVEFTVDGNTQTYTENITIS